MPIRIATAPVSWGVMEVEAWERKQTCAEVLDEMVQAGYVGTELGPYGFLPTEPGALNQELARRKMALVGAFVPLSLADPGCHEAGYEAAMATAKLLAAAGAPCLVLADAMYPQRMAIAGSVTAQDGLSASQWSAAAKLLERIAREARGLGLRSVFHHHAGTYVETPAEVDRLLQATDPALVGLCLDTGHYFYGGGDPVDAAIRHAPRIWHLHLKDIRPEVLDEVRRDRIGFMEAVSRGVFCELGVGAVDIAGVIRELGARGFDGWAVFEQDVDPSRPGVEPAKSAARSREYLRNTAGL